MKQKEREKAKSNSNNHLYKGECIRCSLKTDHVYKVNDLCFGCEQDDLEFEEKREMTPDPNDSMAMFEHEKEQQGWDDSMDEEIWNKHYR